MPNGNIPPEVDFALTFGATLRGTITVSVEAVPASGPPLASQSAQIEIRPSASFSLAIHLPKPGSTLASKIAASYQGAATNLEVASLVYLALILLVFSLLVNLSAQWVVRRVGRRQGIGLRRGGAG